MPQNFFRREEKKYLLTPAMYETMRRELLLHMKPDKYHQSDIYNIYFDTKNDDLIIASLEGPNYKYKVRARMYGGATTENVYLEIKSKLNGVVYKRRVSLTPQQYAAFLSGDAIDVDGQVMREVRYLFETLQLRPKIFIAYRRQAYAATDGTDLRVTLDTRLRSRTDTLQLEDCEDCLPHFAADTAIMEVKTKSGMPQWLTELLSQYQIYPSSFSKYGQIYQQRAGVQEVTYA